jgi:hypothetical protein
MNDISITLILVSLTLMMLIVIRLLNEFLIDSLMEKVRYLEIK